MQTTVEGEVLGVAQVLADDHAKIDQLLGELAAAIDDGELERAARAFPDLSDALARHIRVEDEVLFPALSRNQSFKPPCRCMWEEHRRIESELALIGAAVAGHSAAEARIALRRLARLLAEHNVKEERVLYPRADAALTSAERAFVAAKLQENLPPHAQDIFRAAFNHALDRHSDEPRAFRTAWEAVKRSYEKINGRWLPRDRDW